MSKELEALTRISKGYIDTDDIVCIKTALKEKEVIERELAEKKNSVGALLIQLENYDEILQIIKKKRVDIADFIHMFLDDYPCSLDEYNEYVGAKPLTQEEFDLLKEWLK